MNKFRENFKSIDFGTKNDPLTLFWVYNFLKNQNSCYHALIDAYVIK